MTLQIELGREMEEALEARARLQGLPVGDYALQVLQQAVGEDAAAPTRASREAFRASLDALGASTEGTKLLAEQTYDREFIYGDHP